MLCLSSVGLSVLVFLLHLSLRQPLGGGTGDYLRVLPPLIGAGFCVFVNFPVELALAAEMAPGERVGTSVGALMGGGMILPAVLLPAVGYLVDHQGFGGGMIFLSVVAAGGALLSLGLLRGGSPPPDEARDRVATGSTRAR
jgi:MFS family permease